jgi:hypothetical protein
MEVSRLKWGFRDIVKEKLLYTEDIWHVLGLFNFLRNFRCAGLLDSAAARIQIQTVPDAYGPDFGLSM